MYKIRQLIKYVNAIESAKKSTVRCIAWTSN